MFAQALEPNQPKLAMFTQDLKAKELEERDSAGEIVAEIAGDMRACVPKRLEIGEWLRFNAVKRPAPERAVASHHQQHQHQHQQCRRWRKL